MDKDKFLFDSIRLNMRRAARGAWWLVTPWRLKQRLRFAKTRRAGAAEQEAIDRLFERERRRAMSAGQSSTSTAVDLLDLQQVSRATNLPCTAISWAAVSPADVIDQESAARFCLDLLRDRPVLRERFPSALSDGTEGSFAAWIATMGGDELRLSIEAQGLILEVLACNFGKRARQAFLTTEELRTTLPHGLTPAGSVSLLEWFFRRGQKVSQLSTGEIWWLFVQAAECPAHELREALLFTPEWQQLFPDGSTIFGCERFAAWFSQTYGVTGNWLHTKDWPLPDRPASDLRLGYWANEAWRMAWPRALDDVDQARRWIRWLGSSDSELSEPARRWCGSLDAQSLAVDVVAPGANLLGHFCYPSGLQVSVQSLAKAMAINGVPTSLRDVKIDGRDEPRHAGFRDLEAHDATILHVQPEPHFDRAYERAGLAPRSPRTYRIAYWYWEFDSVPHWWGELAEHVDEIWTATEFVARGMRERFHLPVRTLMPGVSLAPFAKRTLAHFGLDEDRYTFLFTFNMMSVMERKNPLGLIRAFRTAFQPDEPVSLVLKSSFGDRHPAQLQELRDAAEGASIRIIDELYSSDEVLSLMDACDGYVSLHRSEGLGLTMAEAMLMGKPVIATRHSGNVDFMDDTNSLLVDCELVRLGRDIPPYGAHLEWATPSEIHAAQLMRSLYEDQEMAKALGEAAKRSATSSLSLEIAGQRVARRLAEIRDARVSTSGGLGYPSSN
jgi:glycosyltransferase involved in cell wall biosynthesis